MGMDFKTKQVIKQAVQNVVLPVCYQANRGRKVDPKLVVFADAHHNSRPAAMDLLYRKLKKCGEFRLIEHYLDYATAGAAEVAKHSPRFMQLYAGAGFVVICDNFLPVASCAKRRETKVIQLWHACGCYKKFGYDSPDDIPDDYHGANVYRNADLVTVSGEAAVKPFASAMRLPESCVKPVGVSRTDLYFRKKWQERCRRRFYEQYPQASGVSPQVHGKNGIAVEEPDTVRKCEPEGRSSFDYGTGIRPDRIRNKHRFTDESGKGAIKAEEDCSCTMRKKVVLWAPTFRGNAGVPELMPLDLKKLQQELGDEYLVLARLHPHLITAMKKTPTWNVEDYICMIPTEELYPVVDVLIADYSSLIYEYLLFRKPLVLYVPDLQEYRCRRGFYMDIEDIPGQIVTREQDLACAVIEAAQKRDAQLREQGDAGVKREAADRENSDTKLEHFLETYMGACDGKATDRIVEWMRQ